MKKLLMLVIAASFASQALADDASAIAGTVASVVGLENPDFYCQCQNGTLEPIKVNSPQLCSRHKWTGDWVWFEDGIKLSCGQDPDDAERAYCAGTFKGRCKKSGWTGKVYSVADKDFITRPDNWKQQAEQAKAEAKAVVKVTKKAAATPTKKR